MYPHFIDVANSWMRLRLQEVILMVNHSTTSQYFDSNRIEISEFRITERSFIFDTSEKVKG
jgi:hypothetical protein